MNTSPTENTEEERKLELKLIELFSKCTSFGYSFSHSTSKEEFDRMLSDGESIDHQEAAHEAMKLITEYTDQAVQAFGEKVLKEVIGEDVEVMLMAGNHRIYKEWSLQWQNDLRAKQRLVITSLMKGGGK